MALKKIILPPVTLLHLYRYSLVDMPPNPKEMIQQYAGITFLVGFKKHILLLVNNPGTAFLSDSQLAFFSNIPAADKLSLHDIAVINLSTRQVLHPKDIARSMQATTIILAGIEYSALELPFKIPQFQMQAYNGKGYVFIPSLPEIQQDPLLQTRFSALLKTIHSS